MALGGLGRGRAARVGPCGWVEERREGKKAGVRLALVVSGDGRVTKPWKRSRRWGEGNKKGIEGKRWKGG